ncbi:two-partner secretion domain-containing protein [Methylocucumis oryzae]|uniref:Filamentous haemagglutinin FhaB/tRNA nuclease CdiA-like TPS domain-containing protein n=1 Tax=Methylocucumis oryzae TaxID=1632867 RepID=A0A0F3IK55_9GAMM|nr:filamentous hemagglutinin N-terminal domain-containing protein [Methylocucumis oryzae]KJV07047.1 hypothetical protein VZ94_07230 [Methylocucumis oryzae]
MVKQRRFAKPTTHQDFFRLTPLSACVRMAIAGSMIVGAPGVYAELPIPKQVLATMGQASVSSDGTNMTVKQDTDKVILNWEQFNIGKENTVHFDQQNSSSIALNRIFQQDPSQILGKLTADGQVYLYNKNGFVFGKDSVVDVNTLVATTLKRQR